MKRPPVPAIDVHTHLFPERLARAVREALTRMYGWGFDHPTGPAEFAAFVRAHGTERFCILPYAHKPGIARSLNAWTAGTARAVDAIGFACIHQDDEDTVAILEEAFAAGLRGVKLHHQVQEVAPADPRLFPVYDLMLDRDLPLLVHAGRGPTDHPATGAARFRELMERYPTLRICVAHLGLPETEDFIGMLDEYPRLYLDTSGTGRRSLAGVGIERHTDRILFGSDSPNVTSPYERAIEQILELGLGAEAERRVFRENALEFLRL
jgi:hypothetical protein